MIIILFPSKNKTGEPVEIETRKVISTIGAYQLDKIFPFVDDNLISKITSLLLCKSNRNSPWDLINGKE